MDVLDGLFRKRTKCRTLSFITKVTILISEVVVLGFLISLLLGKYYAGEILIQCSSSVALNPKQTSLLHTREYQIKLDPKTFADRTTTIENWMRTVFSTNAHMEIIPLQSFVRTQYQLDASACHTRRYFRVRNYHFGSKQGTSTVDIKVNSMFHEKACAYPLWPADDIPEETITQKCEEDVHECKQPKYSRGTRLSLPEFRAYETCYDLVKLFPYDFTHLRMWELQNKVKIDSTEYWWLGKVDAMMGEIKFTFSFTLRYPSVEEAIFERVVPTGGELSIRVYTRDKGASDQWDEESIVEIERIWRALISKYGNKEC
jgi:hypothetical protein